MKRLTSLLADGVARVGGGGGRRLRVGAAWADVAGPELAARTRARLAGDRVRIEVDDAGWAEQIRNLAPELRDRLERLIGPVSALEVVVRKQAAAARRRPSRAPERLPVPRGIEERLDAIADPDLRRRVGALAAAYLARPRSR